MSCSCEPKAGAIARGRALAIEGGDTGPGGKPKGFGFVFIAEKDKGETVVAALNNSDFEGRNIKVDIAKAKGGKGGGRGGNAGGNNSGKSARELQALREEGEGGKKRKRRQRQKKD